MRDFPRLFLCIGGVWAICSAFSLAAGASASDRAPEPPGNPSYATTGLGGDRTQLLFPFYQGDTATFSGFAVSNFSAEPADVEIQALRNDGTLALFPDNPHLETIPAGQQIAKLGSEIFGIPTSTVQDGWVRVFSDQPDLASFFMFGDGLNGPLTKMDGSVAFRAQSDVLFFTRLYEGPAVFPTINGPQEARTTITVANPNDNAIRVRFDLFSRVGTPWASGVEHTIPARGFLRSRLSTLTGVQFPILEGFLRAQVIQGTGAIGFELIEVDDSILGLNASFGNPFNSAFSAQLASGTEGGAAVFTNFKIVNASSTRRLVTIFAYDEEGQIMPNPMQFALEANQSIQHDVHAVFASFSLLGAINVGSLAIEADGPGVIGDVVFGDPVRADYVAALPLQSGLVRKAVFSQVANGNIDPLGDPRLDTFTGVALFNPGGSNATVTLRVFDRNGQEVGARSIVLGPRRRLSDVLASLVSGSAGLIRGYLTIEASSPVVMQELFGNAALTFLSAVPPHVVQ